MSMTEEQKNCPYCHNLDGHYTYGTFKINYCPICGRKLEA